MVSDNLTELQSILLNLVIWIPVVLIPSYALWRLPSERMFVPLVVVGVIGLAYNAIVLLSYLQSSP